MLFRSDILRAYVNEIETTGYVHRRSLLNVRDSILDDAAQVINKAATIAIIAGGGAVNAGEEVLTLANKLSAVVVQTAAGKGVLDERHPLCLGTRLHFPEVKEMLRRADVVIGIGTQLSSTDLWEVPLSLDGKLIQIDIDPGEFNKNYIADIGIKGCSKDVLNALIPKLDKKQSEEAVKTVSEIVLKAKDKLKDLTGIHNPMDFIQEILGAIRRTIPQDGILCTDMTTPAYVALSEFETYRERTFLHPVGFGTLGYALPAGIGAKLAEPERIVCVLEGDGGFQFTMQELAVAIEEGISLPIIIWNNNGYGEISRNEEARGFGEKIAVDHKTPDFLKLADAYGIRGYRVSNGMEMEEALKQSIDLKGVSLIEVKVREIGG